MHSSTSNSEVKVLQANWLRTWAVAALLALLLLAGWETLWRVRGFNPFPHDEKLWVEARRRVKPDDTVLVGSSRMHADVYPPAFAEASGKTPVQLGIDAGASYLVLENLARDQTFRGTVICELSESEITTGIMSPREKGYVGSFEHETLAGRSESSIQLFMQRHLAFLSPDLLAQLSSPAVASSVLHGQLPAPSWTHVTIGEDRSLLINFLALDDEQVKKQRDYVASVLVYQGPEVSPEEFVARARRIEALAEEIERRGGRVVFVRMPVSGVLWERLEKIYPKASYWAEFARRTHFQTVHFKDYPDLQAECPDYSHLDMRDALRFTRALANIIFGSGKH